MALTNFKKDEPVNDGPSLLCSVPGCASRWSVKLEGQMPKCSHHQWQQPLNNYTKTYKQYLADKNQPVVAKTVSAWYDKDQW
jgi:hypothetical protein